jgi:hypothetical protein
MCRRSNLNETAMKSKTTIEREKEKNGKEDMPLDLRYKPSKVLELTYFHVQVSTMAIFGLGIWKRSRAREGILMQHEINLFMF